jgi:hypothetical protein
MPPLNLGSGGTDSAPAPSPVTVNDRAA